MPARRRLSGNRRAGSRRGRTPYRSTRSGQVMTQTMEIERQTMLRPQPVINDIKWPRPSNGIAMKPYTFYATSVGGNITTSTTVVSGGALTFILSDLPDASSLANVFDQFRILSVKVDFMLLGATNASTGPPGYIQTAIDNNDAVAPTTATDLAQYETFQVVPIGQYFERVLTPSIALPAYTGTLFNGFVPRTKQWVDTNSPNTLHYGIKYFIPVIPTSVYTIQPIRHYQIQFRMMH